MAQWYRCQVTIPNDNGLPADSVVNTFHYMIAGSGDRVTLATDFNAQLTAFYTAWTTVMGSPNYNWEGLTSKHYDFLDPQPRLPFYETTVGAEAADASANEWPAEIALCLSMEGERESGVNMRRRRGRVYCGPLAFGAFDLPRATSTLTDTIADAANAAFFDAGNTTSLAVYSRATHHGVPVGGDIADYEDEIPDNLPASFTPVVRIWTDNAWDTQRRRGLAPTYRKTYNAP